ncbi:MAG: glycine cleavage system aminomethyltransferase GcvT [Elainellaceae cyanobacterium]
MQHTPLHSLYRQQARLTPFAGWEMPVQFEGIRVEHAAVRQKAGLFDISHMGKFELQGPRLLAALEALVPTDLSALAPGSAQYTVLLNDVAGIVDDLILYRQPDRSGQRVTIIANAATTSKDLGWLQQHLGSECRIENCSEKALLALQGPQAEAVLQSLAKDNLSQIDRFQHGEITLQGQMQGQMQGQTAFVARTGYTGEDGFEIMVSPDVAGDLWRSLLAAGVTPCGLGARDTLRLEAAMALYGQDLDETTTPLEAGLRWLVHLDRKPDFLGRGVLERQASGVTRKLVGLQMQGRNIARHGYVVKHDGAAVGKVTSGTLSPTLGYPIALAYVASPLAKLGQAVEVDIRGKAYPALVVKRPFYRRRSPDVSI